MRQPPAWKSALKSVGARSGCSAGFRWRARGRRMPREPCGGSGGVVRAGRGVAWVWCRAPVWRVRARSWPAVRERPATANAGSHAAASQPVRTCQRYPTCRQHPVRSRAHADILRETRNSPGAPAPARTPPAAPPTARSRYARPARAAAAHRPNPLRWHDQPAPLNDLARRVQDTEQMMELLCPPRRIPRLSQSARPLDSVVSNVLPRRVTERSVALEPHHCTRSTILAGHYAATPARRDKLHEGLEGTHLPRSSPGGAVTGETIPPPRNEDQ